MTSRRLLTLPLGLLLVAGALLLAQLPAQRSTQEGNPPRANGKWRLEHRLDKPLLYLSRLGPAHVDPLPLLNDPVLQKLLGQWAQDGVGADASGAVLQLLARLLSRQSEDLELALTQMVRTVDGDTEMPALIFRCQLVAESAGKVGGVLRATLQPSRELHGHQVYGLKAPRRRGNGGVGSEIEVVLAGRNLVVSNDPVALKKAVNPHTAAGPVLSKNTRYQSLRKRIEVPKGAVMLYVNWRRLGPRLSSMLEIQSGLPFRWSGLGDTDRVLVVVRPSANRGSDGFVTSVLLGQRPRPFPGRFPGSKGRIPEARGLDGWLSMVDAAKPQQLLGGLALGGFTNVAMALDPKKLLPTRRGPRMHSMQRWIFGRCTQVGLDIKRQVIRRLDKNCGARVMLLPGDGLTPRVVYSFQARSRRLAQELVQDLQKALIAARRARIRQLESGPVLEIDSPGFGHYSFHRRFGGSDRIYLAAAGDAVHVTFDLATMRMVQGTKSQSRQARAQRDATVRQHLRRLGAWDKKVAGIFAADLGSIADRVLGRKDSPEKGGPEKGGAHHKDQGKSNTRTGLFGMHAGYFTVEQGLVRLEVFSPR